MEKFYITTAIAYVNAAPHIGFALELCQADAIARYHKIQGKEVYFLTGTDEHGTKIQQTAKLQGIEPQELADKNSQLFRDIGAKLNISNDDFIRTSSERHKEGAVKIWNKLVEAGDLYEKEYEGLYCVGCEAFVLEKDLVNGECSIHKKAPERLKEKNWFFKLSKYSEKIKELIFKDELLIRPTYRRNEFLSLLEEGLQDVSFSRPKKTLQWGIDVPGDDSQVMYVWCDALTNYISALGDKVDKFWPADVHLIGKDILRFHAGIWIGMLLSAKIEIPKSILVHGFVTSEGQKMSKSLGNVVDPFGLVDEWGVEPVRYYLLREIPTADDGDFSRERFKVLYEDELANTIGNLLRRTVAMCVKYFDGKVPESDFAEISEFCEEAWADYHNAFADFNIKVAIESILSVARHANAYVEQNKPWELAKTDQARLQIVIANLLKMCRQIGHMLEPIIPTIAESILKQAGKEKVELLEPLFPMRT